MQIHSLGEMTGSFGWFGQDNFEACCWHFEEIPFAILVCMYYFELSTYHLEST